jgi:hypothetical protein
MKFFSAAQLINARNLRVSCGMRNIILEEYGSWRETGRGETLKKLAYRVRVTRQQVV